MQTKNQTARNRRKSVLFTALIILAGLASRKFHSFLPDFIAQYAGDTLWAVMIYCYIITLKNKIAPLKAAIFSVCFCFTIEISQLYNAPWIDNLRANPFFALVLGKGFLWTDLVCYSVGIALIYSLDSYRQKAKRAKSIQSN